MPTLREFFTTEAADILVQLGQSLQRFDSGSGDATEFQRHCRGLRGSAQIAREDRVYRATVGLESAARALASGALAWSEDLSLRVRRSLEDIEALVRGGESEDAADGRVRRSLDRWREVGVTLPEEASEATRAEQVSEASRQFRQFAAHEIGGIVAEMDVSLEMLAADPRNRDPLKAILRRERALLGAARLNELPVIAEALHATEDMTRLIAKLNAPVKEEWLSVFRSAREVLKAAVEPLQKSETPGHTPALSKLRVLRQELMDRYGESEAAGAPPMPATAAARPAAAVRPATLPTPSPSPSPTPTPSPSPSPDEVIPIEQLCYRGQRALQRALELRPEIEKAVADSPARASIDEIFDLIRLGIN